jgi:hypothetical protein
MQHRAIFTIAGALLLWLLQTNVALAGFGITPPYVRNETLRPGSDFSQEIIIVRSDPDEDLNAELTLNTPGFESWLTSDRGLKFLLPKGENQVKMRMTVHVPENAKLGDYTGTIRVRTTAAGEQGSGVSLALGAQLDVFLRVRDEIYDFAVKRVELFDTEEGHKVLWLDYPGKMTFAMQLENTGNVPASPYKIRFEIYDITGRQLLETSESTNSIKKILPFATKRVEAYLPTFLPTGSYVIKYNVMKEKDTSAQVGELSLSIFPKGTISGYVGYGFEGLSLGDKLTLILPAVTFTMVILAPVIGRKKRRTKKPSKLNNDTTQPNTTSSTIRRAPTVRSQAQVRRTPSSGGDVINLKRK